MAAPSFDRLGALDPEGTTRYEFPRPLYPADHPDLVSWLTVERADESNDRYYNALLTKNKRVRTARSARKAARVIAQQRANDRELFPKFVIKAWGGILDDDNKEVPFSAAACAEFLRKLPVDLLDDVRNFCADPENFMDDEGDGTDEEVGKGSPKS